MAFRVLFPSLACRLQLSAASRTPYPLGISNCCDSADPLPSSSANATASAFSATVYILFDFFSIFVSAFSFSLLYHFYRWNSKSLLVYQIIKKIDLVVAVKSGFLILFRIMGDVLSLRCILFIMLKKSRKTTRLTYFLSAVKKWILKYKTN